MRPAARRERLAHAREPRRELRARARSAAAAPSAAPPAPKLAACAWRASSAKATSAAWFERSASWCRCASSDAIRSSSTRRRSCGMDRPRLPAPSRPIESDCGAAGGAGGGPSAAGGAPSARKGAARTPSAGYADAGGAAGARAPSKAPSPPPPAGAALRPASLR